MFPFPLSAFYSLLSAILIDACLFIFFLFDKGENFLCAKFCDTKVKKTFANRPCLQGASFQVGEDRQ